jgi:tRNA(adenine34) deaminase
MDFSIFSETHYMKEALKEAQKAFDRDEVPVGAIIVSEKKIIARSHNLTETLHDVTAHAEMQVITAAANYLGAKYLKNCELYVTLEPCMMCAGAIAWSQIGKVFFGAYDDKKGFSLYQNEKVILHPKTIVVGGIMADESSILLKDFFAKKRKNI